MSGFDATPVTWKHLALIALLIGLVLTIVYVIAPAAGNESPPPAQTSTTEAPCDEVQCGEGYYHFTNPGDHP